MTCGRNPGAFREPVYILKEKLIASFGITDPVHISHISGYKTADILPIFEEPETENKILRLSYKIGRKYYYIHSSKIELLNEKVPENSCEVRLISPMDTIVRDKTWLETFLIIPLLLSISKRKG